MDDRQRAHGHPRQTNRWPALAALVVAVLASVLAAGCTSTSTAPSAAASLASPTAGVACEPTQPNGDTPPGERPSELYHGNGQLWTTLWPGGVVAFAPGGPGEIRADGSLAVKAPFWRGPGVRGELTISGRSLDRPYLRMTGEVPSGYGVEGFQAAALVFPRPGCWEVTARAGKADLTFVVEVVMQP